jgi:succinoglycan biosynthesis transport protein ExoP
MQPNENYSVARRALDIEDYIDIVRRHKGWIFGPFLFAVVVSVVGVYLWPDSYTSQATIRIVPQSVPENLVQSDINQQMYDRVSSMEQEIESRAILTTIIRNFGLYQRELKSQPIEDVVDQMRGKIHIVPILPVDSSNRSVPAFVVQFSYQNDRLAAQRVVADLVSRFIDVSQSNRSNAAFQTTQFMQDQRDQAKKALEEIEGKLAQFRMANNGRLPDQVGGNIQQLGALQAQVSIIDSSINRATEDKLLMESNLRIAKEQYAALSKDPGETGALAQRNEKLAATEREIQNLEDQLSALRQHYKDNHPDVQLAIARLDAARQKRDQLAKEESSKKPEAPVARPPNPQTVRELRDQDANIKRMQDAIEAKNMEIQQYNKEMVRANESLKKGQAQLESVPISEKQYDDLLRDDAIAKQKYVEADEKLSHAQIGREMEDRKEGEFLELLDPPSVPTSPTQPNRPFVIAVGAGLGLLLGIAIAGARELKDTSLKNLKDVRAYTEMTILGSIPLLENDFVVRRRKRMAWLGWTTACLAAAITISGSIAFYYVNKV